MIEQQPVIYAEEVEALWGKELFNECVEEARAIRLAVWEEQQAKRPGIGEIDFEPSPELVFAVALRKLFKISLYNKGDFPP